MYCSNCGQEIKSNYKFCKYCGFKLKDTDEIESIVIAKNHEEEVLENIFFIYKYVIDKGIYLNNPDREAYIENINESIAEIKKSLSATNEIEDYILSKSVKECIKEYVRTEMDFITPGIRGIGRISTSPPRFGGYFSKHLRKLDKKELDEISNIITEIVFCGYYTELKIELLAGSLKKPKGFEYDHLYKKWIPSIYGTNMTYSLPEGIKGLIEDSHINSNIYFFYKVGEKTSFPKNSINVDKIFDGGTLQTIISFYVDAGFILRYLEVS
jgi:hypothetical protein